MSFPRYYILDGHTPRPVDNVLEWARWYETADRHVARDMVGDVGISTIFLGLDHNYFGDGPPLIFETLVFGGTNDGYMERCSTWAEAEASHARVLEMVKGGLN